MARNFDSAHSGPVSVVGIDEDYKEGELDMDILKEIQSKINQGSDTPRNMQRVEPGQQQQLQVIPRVDSLKV
jgi:hypothetical protein